MENEQWPTKYQQSVATSLNRTGDSLNNGNTHNSTEHGESSENICIKEDPDDQANQEIKDETSSPNIIISDKAKQTIQLILEQIKTLSQNEKFLLYLKLPAEICNAADLFRQPLNPLGSRSEISRTICWIKTHLVEDPNISLPKQEVYNEYEQFCEKNSIKPLSQADFGKVMKQVFPKVRARRLGQRGNSKYCYSGLRRSISLKPPLLPDLADKPLSTEAPFTQSSLTAAAWLIVRDWSQQQLGMQFSSLHALAYYLILNCSVGAGTDAAGKVTSAAETHIKVEDVNGKTTSKHREMQLQLQKKIQQKNESKKRKIQSPRAEPKPGSKKCRSASVPAPSSAASSPPMTTSSTNSSSECSASSNSTSPTQGKSICDKSDFTQLPALPDFNSFQKPAAAEGICSAVGDGQRPETLNSSDGTALGTPSSTNKVPIPRLHTGVPVATTAAVVHGVCSAPKSATMAAPRKYKYKAIQPRLQQCDIATYNINKQVSMDTARSQPPVVEDKEKTERMKLLLLSNDCDNEDDDVVPEDFPLTRERLNSVSNVEKDAMDEYLGTNNSQHEEELSKYFCNDTNNIKTDPIVTTTTTTTTATTTTTDVENTTKLSTLRRLLVQNAFSENKPSPTVQSLLGATAATNLPEISTFSNNNTQNPVVKSNQITAAPNNSYVLAVQNGIANLASSILSNNSARRRVSFETQNSEDSSVPPSPNTRRKNFSFTPISSGPHSPNSAQSKCSSTTASPFVSPRNTPIPRMKNSTHQNAGMMLDNHKTVVKVEKELDLSLDILPSVCNSTYVPSMSAPVSPMCSSSSNKSMLQTLLDSSTKVLYKPDYAITQELPTQLNASMATQNQNSVDKFIFPGPDMDISVRPQSVPLHQMLNRSSFPVDNSFMSEMARDNDFTEVDPIPSESDTVKRILNSLDEQQDGQQHQQQCDNNNINVYNVDLSTNNHCLPEYGLHLVNNNEYSSDVPFNHQVDMMNVAQSDSVDVDIQVTYATVKSFTSRSVPNTPLPLGMATNLIKTDHKSYGGVNSRSYPSTPLNSEEIFTYNSDCLLNGQPIRVGGEDMAADNMYIPNFELNGDNNVNQEIAEGDFDIIENGEPLLDDGCILMQPGYNANIN